MEKKKKVKTPVKKKLVNKPKEIEAAAEKDVREDDAGLTAYVRKGIKRKESEEISSLKYTVRCLTKQSKRQGEEVDLLNIWLAISVVMSIALAAKIIFGY